MTPLDAFKADIAGISWTDAPATLVIGEVVSLAQERTDAAPFALDLAALAWAEVA